MALARDCRMGRAIAPNAKREFSHASTAPARPLTEYLHVRKPLERPLSLLHASGRPFGPPFAFFKKSPFSKGLARLILNFAIASRLGSAQASGAARSGLGRRRVLSGQEGRHARGGGVPEGFHGLLMKRERERLAAFENTHL